MSTRMITASVLVQQVADELAMPLGDAQAIFVQAASDGTVAAIQSYVLTHLAVTPEDVEANAVPGVALDPRVVEVVYMALQKAGVFTIYDIAPPPDGTESA